MKKIFLLIITATLALQAWAQDPVVQEPKIVPSPTVVGDPSVFSVTIYNDSSNDFVYDPATPQTATLVCSKWAPTLDGSGAPIVSGAGSIYWDWTANCVSGCGTESAVWHVIGTLNQTMLGYDPTLPPGVSVYAGGAIDITGTAIAPATIAEANAAVGVGYEISIDAKPGNDIDVPNGVTNIYTHTEEQLAVSFSSFDAEAISNDVEVNWATLSESNCDHFEIQRSTDGSNFVTIGSKGSLAGQYGNSTQKLSYTFVDVNAFSDSDNLFYRLKQVDNDLSFSYSTVVQVAKANEGIIKIYPNILHSGESLLVEGKDIKEISIVAPDGRVIDQRKYLESPSKVNVPTEKLISGSYFIMVNQKTSKKIIILN